jgi:tetratricopeptide (TPR) repeat protein
MQVGSRVTWTAAAVGLVIGIPVGALCSGAWCKGAAPSDDAVAPRGARAAPANAAPVDDPALLRAELERLREELAARPKESARQAVDPLAVQARDANAARSAEGGTDELSRLIDSGALYAAFAQDADGAAAFLFETYMRAGLPQDALRVLRAHDLPAESSAEVAQALLAAGDRAGASEALVLGLERHAEDFDWRDPRWGPNLERHDPAGALAALERWKAARGDQPDARMDTRRAALLARLGRAGEARALLDWVWQNSDPNELAWRTLGDVDPQLAESRMLATLEGDGGYDWDNQSRYLSFLRDRGRGEDLTRAAEAWLARPDVDLESSSEFLLAERPALYADALQRRIAALGEDRGAAPDLLAQLALADERLGNHAAAFDHCLLALETNPFHDRAAQWMLERDADRYFATAESTVRGWGNEDGWVSLGNQYLSHGRTDDACRAFEEARRLAGPDDQQWSQRIAMAKAGWTMPVFARQGWGNGSFPMPVQELQYSGGLIIETK